MLPAVGRRTLTQHLRSPRADVAHDHRERWGGVDTPKPEEVFDLPARIVRVDANDGDGDAQTQRTRIMVGRGYRDNVFVGYPAHVVDGSGRVLCEVTLHQVTEARSFAFVPFSPAELEGIDQVVIRPTAKREAPRLARPTEARIVKIIVAGEHLEVTLGFGTQQGVQVGTRGYFELDGRRHEFTVERSHDHPSRTVVAVPLAGTETAQLSGDAGWTFDMLNRSIAMLLP